MNIDYDDIGRKRKYPLINDEKKVCYMLLHVSIPAERNPPESIEQLEGLTSAKRAGKQIGIKVFPMRVNWKDSRGYFRYFFSFPRYQRDDKKAQDIGECFLFSLVFVHGPEIFLDETRSVFRVPFEVLRNKIEIPLDQLEEIEESRSFFDRTLESPFHTLGAISGTTGKRYDAAWKITPMLLKNESIYHAVRFIEASKKEFCIYPGEVRDVLNEPDQTAITGSDQTRFENSLQNAFKAIEAVIGDPPKKDARFFLKLKSIGLDPNIEVGYREKRPIFKFIREMNNIRDKKAAHGSTKNREITVCELMEYQECAHSVVWVAIENLLGEHIFSD